MASCLPLYVSWTKIIPLILAPRISMWMGFCRPSTKSHGQISTTFCIPPPLPPLFLHASFIIQSSSPWAYAQQCIWLWMEQPCGGWCKAWTAPCSIEVGLTGVRTLYIATTEPDPLFVLVSPNLRWSLWRDMLCGMMVINMSSLNLQSSGALSAIAITIISPPNVALEGAKERWSPPHHFTPHHLLCWPGRRCWGTRTKRGALFVKLHASISSFTWTCYSKEHPHINTLHISEL